MLSVSNQFSVLPYETKTVNLKLNHLPQPQNCTTSFYSEDIYYPYITTSISYCSEYITTYNCYNNCPYCNNQQSNYNHYYCNYY